MTNASKRFIRERCANVVAKRITKEDIADFNHTFDFSNLSENHVAFGLFEANRLSGLCVLKMNDIKYADIIHLSVDESARRNGYASVLLARVKGFLLDNCFSELYVQFEVNADESEYITRFFKENGFIIVERGSKFIFTLSDLVKNEQYKKFCVLKAPENAVCVTKLKNFRDIPIELLPMCAEGEIIPEISLGIQTDDEVKAFCTFSRVGEQICLAAAYVQKGFENYFGRILFSGLAKICESELPSTEMFIRSINRESYSMIKKVVGDDYIKEEGTYGLAWTLDTERIAIEQDIKAKELAMNVTGGMEILIPKLERLSAILYDENISSYLTLRYGFPLLVIDNNDDTIYAEYVPLDDDFSSFQLNIFRENNDENEENEDIIAIMFEYDEPIEEKEFTDEVRAALDKTSAED